MLNTASMQRCTAAMRDFSSSSVGVSDLNSRLCSPVLGCNGTTEGFATAAVGITAAQG